MTRKPNVFEHSTIRTERKRVCVCVCVYKCIIEDDCEKHFISFNGLEPLKQTKCLKNFKHQSLT